MNKDDILFPEYLLEISTEVCNKVGGIHTVISTKAKTLTKKFGDKYIVIGPDYNREYNIEFEEDISLLKHWKQTLLQEGIRIRIGRWKIEGAPITILVDFSSFLPNKDTILTMLWNKYKVDSITGQWDYIEPVMFGYAAAKTIKCIYSNFFYGAKTVANFHEWLTASGVLTLNNEAPDIGTVFTTHATVVGRCIASNGLPLYHELENYNADEIATRFGVKAKHSVEKAAVNNCDCFTTVSEITSNECKYLLGKAADVITPNGFEDEFVFPKDKLEEQRAKSRDLIIKVARAVSGKNISDNPLIVGTSGRYEFRNKGLDEFIDSLAVLNHNTEQKRDIIAYIMVPGWNLGPRKDLKEYINGGEFILDPYTTPNVTHYLGDSQGDLVLNKLRSAGLIDNPYGKVTAIFIPAYLNSDDGIFNCHYYSLLCGFDVTIFPSYYEPWGYTPLESIAFSIPTVTTTLTGFGIWMTEHSNIHKGVTVIERSDSDSDDLRNKIANVLILYSNTTKEEFESIRDSARELSKFALWKNLIINYYTAYSMAVKKLTMREESTMFDGGENHEQVNYIKHQLTESHPTWTRVIIDRKTPERLKGLDVLAHNLWWSWNSVARELFESIDKELWDACKKNPIALIDNLSSNKLKELINDNEFLDNLDKVYDQFNRYMAEKEGRLGNKVCYFSMEYGLHSSLKIYSGGLGILAGDYLKEASDKNINMVAVGLLYRYGYFDQKISTSGEQEASYEAQNFYKLPITPMRDSSGNWVTISIEYPGRTVIARIWRCDVGRTELYLLDTDHDLNSWDDRSITHHLYGGDWENRLKQEILLGIGGVKTLERLDIEGDVYHCNEGHAAFMGLHRIRTLIDNNNLSFSEALEVCRSSSLFTTHTPVPAGHDAFPEDMMRQYMSIYPELLRITWEQFINLGKQNPTDPNERFSMSFLACNLCQEVNGVSWLHGEVSKDILGGMWPGYFKDELHIGYVTNGVHAPTWTASSLIKIYDKEFGPSYTNHTGDRSAWQNIYKVDDKYLWDKRLYLKNKLIKYIIKIVKNPSLHRLGSPSQIVKISESLKPDILTIGFARRFATYKRAYLIFSDLERLDKIVNNPERPVQFLFAGKAHPNDKPGQDLIKRIVEVSSMPQFVGKILFLQNYDMELARRLVQGVDVWMNTPTRPLEASGTSGEKGVMNGVLHFSVLDGWWVEGYQEGAGWALPLKRTFTDQHFQDQLDAELIYTIIEEEIAPAYYNKDKDGLSHEWLGYVKKCIAEVASNFTTTRMIDDYVDRFYNKLSERHTFMIENNFTRAREIAAWKRRVSNLWADNVFIVSAKTYDVNRDVITAGHVYTSEVIIDLGELSPSDIGVEMVMVQQQVDGEPVKLIAKKELLFEKLEGKLAYYKIEMIPENSGSFDVAIRVYAKHKYLAHRQDFALVKWS